MRPRSFCAGPGGGRQADAAGADDQNIFTRADLGGVHPVQSNGEGLYQRGVVVGKSVGQFEALARGDDRELSESTAIGTHADVPGLAAMCHHAISTGRAGSTRNNRQHSNFGSHSPVACICPHSDDLATEFVTHDQARRHVRLRFDVGPANAARRDPDDKVGGARCRIRDVDDVEAVLLVCDRGLHASSSSTSKVER